MKIRNLNEMNTISSENFKNKNLKTTLKKIRIPYSLKNKRTKEILENSVLKPLTNSLSPSARSNGARFNSQIIDTVKIMIIKKRSKKNIISNIYLLILNRKQRKRKVKEIS